MIEIWKGVNLPPPEQHHSSIIPLQSQARDVARRFEWLKEIAIFINMSYGSAKKSLLREDEKGCVGRPKCVAKNLEVVRRKRKSLVARGRMKKKIRGGNFVFLIYDIYKSLKSFLRFYMLVSFCNDVKEYKCNLTRLL